MEQYLLSGILTEEASTNFSQSSFHSLARCLQDGNFEDVLTSEAARHLLGVGLNPESFNRELGKSPSWAQFLESRVRDHVSGKSEAADVTQSLEAGISTVLIGIAAFHAFLQSNVTGPPLPFSVSDVILPPGADVSGIHQDCLASLTLDGVAVYQLTPAVELFCLAKAIFNGLDSDIVSLGVRWWRMRVNFLHQRMLSESSSTLQANIYADMTALESEILVNNRDHHSKDEKVRLLLEMAAINTYYSHDAKARLDLEQAAKETDFQFAMTGRLGKRTKFQDNDISQLVLLARSATPNIQDTSISDDPQSHKEAQNQTKSSQIMGTKPIDLDLNDDTLLESISFTPSKQSALPTIQDNSSLPAALSTLDPSDQPPLNPLDSIVLLHLASSITNTSPTHGLTREETLPYATRVLDGGSTNWQVYTQALLIRSRIEGYRSRTMERGLLQLQALVDQVITETASGSSDTAKAGTATTFLPRATESEAAPVTERLKYIHQLCSPTRWELEAELAARWVSLGGLRTALEIYERLQMWAEVALCWAGVDQEDKARKLIRKQLFKSSKVDDASEVDESESWEGEERVPPPADAPRLWCILGDIDHDPKLYEHAWDVSKGRYARAQRSLGRHYFSDKEYSKAEKAYVQSLKINGLNQGSWFALGCVRLELENWDGAVEAFARSVQLDDQDAESWSNLATALLRKEVKLPAQDKWLGPREREDDDVDDEISLPPPQYDPYQSRKDALNAFKRAVGIKYENWRIWENLLTVAASLHPPAYLDVVIALKRIVELRGPTVGEKCVDVDILELLVRHIITADMESDNPVGYNASRPGLSKMAVELVEKDVVPLITSSRRLWQIVAKLALWRKKPTSALEANEKAWRAVISQPGWEYGTQGESQWNEVVDATIDLVDAYQSLGTMERTEGLGAGQLVAKDWKFKARSAVRGIMGRGKDSWQDTRGWDRLVESLEALKGSN